MAHPGGIDLNFITITKTVADLRRRMLRCNSDTCFATTSSLIDSRVRQASAGQDEESIHPVAPVIRSIHVSSSRPACLLLPKIWVTSGIIRTSQTIIQFLCGCPRRIADANNPLRACQSHFRKHTDRAMVLLVLLRLRHGSNHDAFPAADNALLYSLKVPFVLLRDIAVHDWRTWIFRESLIRTAIIYFLLTILVSTKISVAPSTVLRFRDLIGTEGNHPNSGTAHQREAWLEGVDELGLITSISSTLAT
ncbi:hypothetical protein V8C42DRAFT_356308 [Trichoderma barbatum]